MKELTSGNDCFSPKSPRSCRLTHTSGGKPLAAASGPNDDEPEASVGRRSFYKEQIRTRDSGGKSETGNA